MADRAYWQHSRTGEVWAVESVNGRPTACAGPITPADALPLLLPWLQLSTTQVSEIRMDWPLFFRREECPVCANVLLPGATTVHMPTNGRSHLSCSLNPPPVQTDSVGACVRVEPLWQRCARLQAKSRACREASRRPLARSAALRLLT